MAAAVERGTLMAETQRLLKARKETLVQIHVQTGIPFYWLRRFVCDEIPNPSVNRVQKLWEYLTGRKLLAS